MLVYRCGQCSKNDKIVQWKLVIHVEPYNISPIKQYFAHQIAHFSWFKSTVWYVFSIVSLGNSYYKYESRALLHDVKWSQSFPKGQITHSSRSIVFQVKKKIELAFFRHALLSMKSSNCLDYVKKIWVHIFAPIQKHIFLLFLSF